MSNRIACVVLAAVLVTGCETMSGEQGGTLFGAIAGALVGSQFGSGSGQVAAAVAGSVIGGMAGAEIGKQMDENDRLRKEQALDQTPTNQSSTWFNPDTGRRYKITPLRTYASAEGPCREFQADAFIDGQRETVVGKACRQSDGTWKTIN